MNFIKRNSFGIGVDLTVFVLIGAALISTEINATEYKEACSKSGGSPVFNGKFWECIK